MPRDLTGGEGGLGDDALHRWCASKRRPYVAVSDDGFIIIDIWLGRPPSLSEWRSVRVGDSANGYSEQAGGGTNNPGPPPPLSFRTALNTVAPLLCGARPTGLGPPPLLAPPIHLLAGSL